VEAVREVLTLTEAARRSRRSRRQLYRDIASGRVRALGRFGREWLVAGSSLPPPRGRGLPGALGPLFPEVPIGRLDPVREQPMVLARILEGGNREEVRWALRRYGRPALVRFLREDGPARLSPKALLFWGLTFKTKTSGPARDWREAGRRLWGVG